MGTADKINTVGLVRNLVFQAFSHPLAHQTGGLLTHMNVASFPVFFPHDCAIKTKTQNWQMRLDAHNTFEQRKGSWHLSDTHTAQQKKFLFCLGLSIRWKHLPTYHPFQTSSLSRRVWWVLKYPTPKEARALRDTCHRSGFDWESYEFALSVQMLERNTLWYVWPKIQYAYVIINLPLNSGNSMFILRNQNQACGTF